MAIVRVQDAGNNGVSLSSIAVTLSPTSGNNLLVARIGTLTATVSSISGGGQTWVKADNIAQGTVNAEIWYSANVDGGTTTITVSLSGADAVAAGVTEYAGCATTSPLDTHNHSSGTTASPTTGSATPTKSTVVAVACANYVPTTSTVSSQTANWTALTNEDASTSLALVGADNIRTNGGAALSDTWTLTPTSATAYAGAIAIFVAAGTFVTKFYLHDATTTDVGTLPGAAASISATTPTKIASGVNRSMNATIGTLQASVALTTNAVTTAQASLIARFVSAPLAAQGIAALAVAVHWAGNDSNTSSNFNGGWSLALWRPSTGAIVTRIADLNQSTNPSFNSTTQVANNNQTLAGSVTAATVVDGDILVLELWRDATTQGMATAYTNTVFYDGTTEDSTTTNAAYLLLGAGVLLYVLPGPLPPRTVRQAVNRSAVI